MSDFTSFSDLQVVRHLLDQFDDIGVGAPDTNLAGTLMNGIESGHLVVEKRLDAFAIVARPNRKHPGRLSFIYIPPEADLMFLMVAADARGKGVGNALLIEMKARYMEDQAMKLVCAGEKRKRMFQEAGFVEVALNEDGHHVMVCHLQELEQSK
jgi:N-acetylglutamate synthase-like GNAT family acetyltransferase